MTAPSDRDKIITKVAEAMAIEVNRQRDTGELRVDTSGRRSLARRDAGVIGWVSWSDSKGAE